MKILKNKKIVNKKKKKGQQEEEKKEKASVGFVVQSLSYWNFQGAPQVQVSVGVFTENQLCLHSQVHNTIVTATDFTTMLAQAQQLY